ncbi:MAG TPA: hypothetical protein VK929_07665 [Longimicrobiales bacterium]|nr:hypothetical protein [Longimicrobiales bacterium]
MAESVTTGRAGMRLGLVAVSTAMVMACGGDGTAPVDVIPAQLAGTWTAEPACLPHCGLTLASLADPADSVNITAFTGIATDVVLTRDGTFRLRSRPGPDTASVAAVRAESGMLIVTDADGQIDTLDYALSGQYLQLAFRRTFLVFDFTGDGVMDPARARGSFQRR